MYGFPGVSFVTAATGTGLQIGAAAQRSRAFAKVAVRLAPGGTAHAWLKVAVAGNYPATSCHPATAHWLRIYPPGETAAGRPARLFDCAPVAAGGSWCHADTGVSMAPSPYLAPHGGREFVSRCTHFLNRSVISGT